MKSKPIELLIKLYSQQSCWTIEQLCQEMNYSAISIRRFLKQIKYFSSFTHNGKYYTISTIPNFNKNGICFINSIGFSKHGNLKQIIVHFINKSSQGLSAKQLAEILSIPCHAVLNHLYKSGAIDRFKNKSGFVYISSIPKKKEQQLMRLQSLQVDNGIHEELTAHSAVYVLVAYIKQPQASFAQLSQEVAKKQVIAAPEAIERFFKKHDLKKTLL